MAVLDSPPIPRSGHFKRLDVAQDARVLTVRVNNPPLHLLSNAVIGELDLLTRQLEHDRSVGSVVITGAADEVFVTHADTFEMLAGARQSGNRAPSYQQASVAVSVLAAARRIPRLRRLIERSPMAGLAGLQRADDVFLRMNRSNKVFIAAINGLALGGGFILALACDLRLIAESNQPIGLAESTLGFLAAAGGTQRLVRAVGNAAAIELLLDGLILSPQEAFQRGLVHRVVPAEALMDEATATAARLARRSPTAVAEIKRVIYDAGSRPLQQGIRIEEAGMLATLPTPASMRALTTYNEELEGMDSVTDADFSQTWDRLREGTLSELWHD